MSVARRSWIREWGWVALLFLVLIAYQRTRGSIRLTAQDRAQPAGDLVLRDPAGGVRTLADSRGEVVVLNLWAEWCGPCRREVPRLSRLLATLESEGLRVWAINADSLSGSELERAAERLGIDYPVAEAVRGLDTLGGGEVLPYVWLIDRQGRVRARHGGLARERALLRACKELLAEPG